MNSKTESYPDSRNDGSREKQIIRTSVIGIFANVLLAGFKAVIGLMTHSIAIVLDAVNNLSDAASSVITIVGAKLAGRPADRKHPFGYGRVEYLSALVISLIVLYAGITSFTESVKKIITPDTPDYSAVALIIVTVGVLVKIVLGRYVKGVGERVNSDSLINSGQDAVLDSVISASTLVAAVLYLTLHISLEAWLGAIISLVIIKSGIDMIRETLSRILGERADAGLAQAIRETVNSFPEVSGAYDLVLHDYGPDTYNGSIHIEIPDTLTAGEVDELTRSIQEAVYRKHNLILGGISVYSVNTSDPEAVKIRQRVQELVLGTEYVLQMHGFYVKEEEKSMRFDIVISFDADDAAAVCEQVRAKVQEAFPEYRVLLVMDVDFTGAL